MLRTEVAVSASGTGMSNIKRRAASPGLWNVTHLIWFYTHTSCFGRFNKFSVCTHGCAWQRDNGCTSYLVTRILVSKSRVRIDLVTSTQPRYFRKKNTTKHKQQHRRIINVSILFLLSWTAQQQQQGVEMRNRKGIEAKHLLTLFLLMLLWITLAHQVS